MEASYCIENTDARNLGEYFLQIVLHYSKTDFLKYQEKEKETHGGAMTIKVNPGIMQCSSREVF